MERADGNPLLVVETARALGRGLDEVAPSLRGSVRATLRPLSGDVRKLVEIAAIAARPLQPAELKFEWRLEPAGAGTLITVDVEIPDAEAHRLDRQREIISTSMRQLAELAANG